jgi:hypothetical protein
MTPQDAACMTALNIVRKVPLASIVAYAMAFLLGLFVGKVSDPDLFLLLAIYWSAQSPALSCR